MEELENNSTEIVSTSISQELSIEIRESIAETFLRTMSGSPKEIQNEEILKKQIAENIGLLQKIGVDVRSVSWGSAILFMSSSLELGIHLSQRLGGLGIDSLIDIVQSLDSESKGNFSKDLFEECVEYFGVEKMRSIFTCNENSVFTQEGNIDWVSTLDDKDQQERKKFIEFCTQINFPSGNYIPRSIFLEDLELTPICYLGGYSPEIRYIIEHFNVSFENLFELPIEQLGTYCGTLKSLMNGYYRSKGLNEYVSDFSHGRTPVALTPEQIFSIDAITHFNLFESNIPRHSINHIKDLFEFLRENSDHTGIPFLGKGMRKEIASAQRALERERKEKKKIEDEQHRLQMQELIKHQAIEDKKLSRSGRNFSIITSLAKNLQGEQGLKSIVMPDGVIGQTNDVTLLRSYINTVQKFEEKYKGLYSVGGKIHFPEAIPEELINQFQNDFQFNKTSFRMIHANTSLLLPPSQYPEELMFMIGCMSQYGLLGDDPQLQISIPGRLPNEKGAILGSSLLLLSQQNVSYTRESFSTTHNSETGRRLIAYDAGVYDSRGFKWNGQTINGRTDILLLKDINLIPKAQVIGSLVSQTEYDGMFADLGVEFILEYCELLAKYGKEDILRAPWIYENQDNSEESLDLHFNAVKALTEQQYMDYLIYNSTKLKKGLISFELQKLLTTYRGKIQSIQRRFSK